VPIVKVTGYVNPPASSVISVRLFPELIQKLETLMQSTGIKTKGEMIRRLIEEKDFNPPHGK